MTTLTLRGYQEEGLKRVVSGIKEGVFRQLVVLPTGSGKTILMAAIAKHYNKKMLILAHRGELLTQAKDKIHLFWPEADIGFCKAKQNELGHQIVVGSVQTCSQKKRLQQLKEQNFQILIIDEAHHTAANSYQKIIKELGFDQDKPLIGFTATPHRADNKQLGNTFQGITYSRPISKMIKEGYLSPVHGRKILTNLLLKKLKTQMGDFAIGDLSEAVNTQERNEFVVSKYKTYAKDRKAIAFCVDVKHSKDLAREFRKQGFRSYAVYGAMSEKGRKYMLKRLERGTVDVLTCCNLLTEGFDLPALNAIVMARPTKSKGLYIQMAGRGLRPHPGKQDCIILDFTDQYHKLDNIISLEKAIPDARVEEEGLHPEQIDNTPKLHIDKEVDQIFNLFGSIAFMWISIKNGEYSLTDDYNNEIVVSQLGDKYVATLYGISGETKTLVSDPLPFNYCIGTCEEFARANMQITFAAMDGSWAKKNQQTSLTQNQERFLRKNYAYKKGMSKLKASLAIRKIIAIQRQERRNNTITRAQKTILKRNGIDYHNFTKEQASSFIEDLKTKGTYL